MRPFAVLPAVVAFAASLIGCDPVFAVQYRQALNPAPAQDCVSDALAASRVVTVGAPVPKKQSGLARAPGFRVTARDTTELGGASYALIVTRAAMPDSAAGAQVAVTYHYMGGGPRSDERRRLEVLANQILAEVRAACAPATAPAAVECRRLDALRRNGWSCSSD